MNAGGRWEEFRPLCAPARTEFCFIVACDLPFLTSELLAQLWQMDERRKVRLPRRLFPCRAMAGRSRSVQFTGSGPCLIATEKSIALGEHTPRAMLDKDQNAIRRFQRVRASRRLEDFFFNLNRPEDYERAKEIARRREARRAFDHQDWINVRQTSVCRRSFDTGCDLISSSDFPLAQAFTPG